MGLDVGENERKEQREKAVRQYKYGEYQIRVHFSEEKTLIQCMKNLMERSLQE